MNKPWTLACLASLLISTAAAQSDWLPRTPDPSRTFRLLDCRYDKARLQSATEITPNSAAWTVDVQNSGDSSYVFTFRARQALRDAGVAVAFDQYGWSSDNYVMIPSVVYAGNRQRIVNRQYATGLDATDYYRRDLALTSNPIPQLSPEFGAPSRLEVLVCNAATPAITWLDRKNHNATILLTDQGIERDGEVKDHALIVQESLDRDIASFVISAPGVRELKPEFIGFSPSPDRGISVQPGDSIVIRVTRLNFPANDVPQLLARFMHDRKRHTAPTTPRNLMPMSEVHQRMIRNIEERYHVSPVGEYYCPENADWMSYGWIGGLMNTWPMLALDDTMHLRRVANTFDFALLRGYGESGYYYDVLGADGKPLLRDAAKENPGIGLTRKNADLLYWLVKQFDLLRKQGRSDAIRPEWTQRVQKLADAFVKTWQTEGTWGNYLDLKTGDIAVWNTTGGAMAVGGLALASKYYNNPEYLDVARKAADFYYHDFARRGFTSGGCGDILQNADSETAAALMTSLMTLYETTGEKCYLEQCRDLANLCATWTVSFRYRLPAETPLAKLGADLTGAVWASTQNKHGAPGFCTQSGDALLKLYRATGDTLYAALLRDIIHAHAEGVQPNGKITERLTYCDADSRGSRGDGGQTGWNETNGALMAVEIPGIYLRTDLDRCYVFDHVTIQKTERDDRHITLTLHNPTAFDATVTVLAENAEQAAQPLGDNAFLQWNDKVTVKAGRTAKIKIPR
ncbi:glycoside hydrolase family 76 protein [Millionella massiliensis]|uniref:glycoside hydrolase family 76 protein n=1 Tax=Millionella massiliensis TaxID=1871023 RepID=UPI0008DB249E|nr:glycoside hydrolase family 76 protein [Millionella massiliensis]